MLSRIYAFINVINGILHKLKIQSIEFGKKGFNVTIAKGFYCINSINIHIDDYVYIGPKSTIYAHGQVY